MTPDRRSWLTALALVALVLVARVRYTGSDPRVTLLTAQAVLETGHLALDRYLTPEVVERELSAPWALWRGDGATYNFYPPGTSLLALPAVAVARALGLDLVREEDDALLQVVLASLLVAAIFLVFERTARCVVASDPAYVVSLVAVLGTSVTSTLGTALWSHGPTVLLGALAARHLVAAEAGGRAPNGLVLGLYLGGAFWCRPTAAVPAAVVLGYLVVSARREVPRYVAVGAAAVAALVGASLVALDRPLPVYYLPTTWPVNAAPLTGLLGVLVSPGRGLLTFSPFLVVGLVGVASRRLRRQPLFLLALAWAGLQALLVARNADWWGGWCYGPRLLSDSLPAWFVLVVLTLPRLEPHVATPLRRRVIGAMLAATAACAIGVHTVQGLFNRATWSWNDRPNVYDAPLEKLFDLTNPQFLATWRRNDAAAASFKQRTAPSR